MTEDPRIIVHRDVGRGFHHEDSEDCPCCPHVIDKADRRSTNELLKEIDQAERPN